MEKIGYKAFNKGLMNWYGVKFELNTIYSVPGEIKWGNDGNGFHFCTYLEDCLRYFDGIANDIDIAIVKCSGDMIRCDDDYYGYFEMYVARNMEIIKVMSREEIINHVINNNRLYTYEKFIQGYNMNAEEKIYFKKKL